MRYPIGIQTFQKLREGDFLYVDKTAIVHRLVQSNRYNLLCRPRRFGKSLTVSTLEAYFEGKRELFKGLAIEELEKDWTVYPVLRLDFNSANYSDKDALQEALNITISKWEKIYGKNSEEISPAARFCGVIERAYEQTGKQVVILIDEYDKPLLANLEEDVQQDDIRRELKAFYSVLKTQDRYIRFAFLTGVTKFSKVSIFSDLNNLSDITLDERFESLCGITQAELDDYFHDPIKELSKKLDVSIEEVSANLKARYDGYHFSARMTDIYNPFSLLNAFSKQQLGSYWFETGTPTFLVRLVKRGLIDAVGIDNVEMSASELGNVDVVNGNAASIFFQSGYITIKNYNREFNLYRLGVPNGEVAEGLYSCLLPTYTTVREGTGGVTIYRLTQSIYNDDIDEFLDILASFFADYNYELIPRHDLERHYQNVIFIVCKLLGLRVDAEYHTSAGRVDLIVQTTKSVFLFEFKLNTPPSKPRRALRQIEVKDYAAAFKSDPRHVYKIGVNFDSEIRGIKDWEIE